MMKEADGRMAMGKLPDFDGLWDYDHPGTSERKFRELLPLAVDSRDLSYMAELLTQIARAEGMQRKFQDAQKTLDRVESVLPQAEDRVWIRYLLERGRVFNSSGKADDARSLFQEAFDRALGLKMDLFAVEAAHLRAVAEPVEKRLEWSLKALDLAENSADEKARKWKGSLYNSIGWTYFDQEEYQEALFMFEKNLELCQQQGDPAKIRIAKWSLAKVLRVMDHIEEALEMQRGLFEEYQGEGRRNGYVYEEIAECLLVMGDPEARGWFAAAYEELSKDPRVASDEDRLNRLKELGGVGKPGPAST